MKRSIALVAVSAIADFVAALAFAHAAARPQGSAYVYTVPPALDDGWTTGSLEQASIDRRRPIVLVPIMTSARSLDGTR